MVSFRTTLWGTIVLRYLGDVMLYAQIDLIAFMAALLIFVDLSVNSIIVFLCTRIISSGSVNAFRSGIVSRRGLSRVIKMDERVGGRSPGPPESSVTGWPQIGRCCERKEIVSVTRSWP
uniref:Uncharacterized protein n=1 Tax=Cacopsylla melanoneura TaxID=428564 RepID=A0A8D8MHF8_9HEMI